MGMLDDLIAQLDALDGTTVTVHVEANPQSEEELLKRLLAKLNRPGGPKISSRAIV